MQHDLMLRFADFDSYEYEEMVLLRHKILREPLGMEFTQEQLDMEHDSFHLGAYYDNVLVGCLILKAMDNGRLKMRQVCVAEKFQKEGVGKGMCVFAEEYAKGEGYQILYCHARAVAAPFYDKLGYVRVGDPFDEVGLEHYLMELAL